MNKPKRPLRAVRLVLEKNTDKNNDGYSQMLNVDVKPRYDSFGIVNSCN
ncbi:F-box family protein, partial [Trifolium medium]|nr:F-box family protein [Trifolium medium]